MTDKQYSMVLGDSMEEEYSPKNFESKWQDRWNEKEIFVSDITSNKEKYYCLEMYPYPSGKMHMGHVRNYSIGDTVARYRRARGFNVIYLSLIHI